MKLNFYPRLYSWLSNHRPLVFTVVVIITVLGILITTRLDLEEDILAILPQRDEIVDQYQYTLKKFRGIDRVYIDVGIATNDTEELFRAADAFAGGIATNPALTRVMYRFEFHGQRRSVDLLTSALPNLFTASDAQALQAKLDPKAIRDYLTAMRRRLSGPEGMVLKDVVPADPIGMSGLVLNKLLPLEAGFGDAHMEDGRILSADHRHVLIMAEPNFPSSNSRTSAVLVKDLLQTATSVEQQFPGVHVAITGGHRMTVDNANLIRGDADRCILLGMVAMLALCLTAYRRRWLATVTFLPSFFGTLMAGVVLALCYKHLSAIATGFATIAIGITVDYAIYVVYHLDNAAGLDREGVGRHIAQLVLPITVGALTTIAAFVVMATSPMHGYQQLGVFGAVGVFFSALFALLVLPLLVPIPKEKGQPPLWLTQLLEKFYAWRKRRLPWLMVGVLLLTILSFCGLRKLRFEGDIAALNGITPATRHDDELIRSVWGDTMNMTLVITRGTNTDEALARNDRVAETLAHQPGITNVFSIAAICPSRETQAANIQRWQAFWTAPRREQLHKTLQQVGGELGFRSDAFTTFWQRLDVPPAILTLATFHDTPLEQAMAERVAVGNGDTAVSTLLKLDDRSRIQQLRAALPEAWVLDKKAFAQHIAGLAKSGLGKFALYTSVSVALIVYLSLASVELVAATLLPLAFGLLWTFGAMAWLGLPIDIMNSVFVIFIIGIGEDYSVFLVTCKLDEWRGRPQRLAATSAAVTISALTTIFGFAVLVFARHPVLYSMGTTVLLGMACTFVATLILTQLCMDLLLFADPPRGAPRWWHLLTTIRSGLHLLVGELFLFGIWAHLVSRGRLRSTTRWMTRGLLHTVPFGKLEVIDISEATFRKPAIVISNHQSAVDVLVIKSLPGDIRMTPKKRVWDSPILGIGCQYCEHVLVEPDQPAITLARCREKLSEGASIHFFPEGTRSLGGDLQRFHLGAFQLAIELQQDVLPILLCDTNTAMPRDAYWLEPHHAVVRALPRVTPQAFDYNLGARALMKHCETIIRTGLQSELDRLNTPPVLRRKVGRLYRYLGKWVEQFVYWKMRTDSLFTVLNQVAPRQGLILDLGCGYGIATHWLAYGNLDRQLLGVDYDADKIVIAKRTAPNHSRVRFEQGDILTWEFPACDGVLLFDVLHYWVPEKQELILTKARQALRNGGKLVVRDAARAATEQHQHVAKWEKFATGVGHNKTVEGLHFLSEAELRSLLTRAGFENIQLVPTGSRDSNIMLTATAGAAP